MRKVGSVRDLVKPTMRAALEPRTDREAFEHLLANPQDLRRPIIVRGDEVLAGFNAETQARLMGVAVEPKAKGRTKPK